MTGYSYSTGLLMFGLLDKVVGREKLLAFLGGYFRTHHESGSRDADFVASLSDELGHGAEEIVREWFSSPEFTARLENSASWQEVRESVGRSR
jgi:aminopeptidase N